MVFDPHFVFQLSAIVGFLVSISALCERYNLLELRQPALILLVSYVVLVLSLPVLLALVLPAVFLYFRRHTDSLRFTLLCILFVAVAAIPLLLT